MPEGPYNTQLTAQYISATYDRAVEVAASQSAKGVPAQQSSDSNGILEHLTAILGTAWIHHSTSPSKRAGRFPSHNARIATQTSMPPTTALWRSRPRMGQKDTPLGHRVIPAVSWSP